MEGKIEIVFLNNNKKNFFQDQRAKDSKINFLDLMLER